MLSKKRLITAAGFFFILVTMTAGSGWCQMISFVGVTNVNRPDGLHTYLDLGPNVPVEDVKEAFVLFPDGTRIDFAPSDYYPFYNEYFKEIDGSPDPGIYTFTLIHIDDSMESASDTQGPLETLPIIAADQIDIISGAGVTPTFRWPAVEGRVLSYRFRVYDTGGNEIFRTARIGSNAYVTLKNQLMPNTDYQCRVEIHDSPLWESLDNRSNGEMRTFTTGDEPVPSPAPLEVITVPWVATAPLIPHDAYNGKPTTFKAMARGGDGSYIFEWDFDGDGVFDFSGNTPDRYDLSAQHTYPDQTFDRIFIARIRVTSNGQSVSAQYPVRVHAVVTQGIRVNVAIDDALWRMHQRLERWESGGIQFSRLPQQMLGATGAAVQAWENQGHKPGGDYNLNPYVEDVRSGLNLILAHTHPYPIQVEDGRDPDTNANGFGIHSTFQSQLYETGIVLMALASSGDPGLTCQVGGFGMQGRTYGDIAQDMADFLAFAQNEPDTGEWRGGWRYSANFAQSDMSVTQWPVIGLEAAESNFGTSVPQYVKDELALYLTADQDSDGGFGYTSPGGNVARTGAGIACLDWIGVPAGDPRVMAAIGFIDSDWDWDHLGNLYAMYAVMKGMRGFDPDLTMIGSHDWYSEYADFLVNGQLGDGSWTSFAWYANDLATASGVLILTPQVFVPPPVAIAKASPTEASPGTVITFSHADSYHRDPQSDLVAFRWDFDENGTWDFQTGDIAETPTFVYDDDITCGEEVQHLAVLEVEDDQGNTDVDDETVVIRINLINHPPVADGAPGDSYPDYEVDTGRPVLLDAGESYDPDSPQGDEITLYEWDLDNDGTFDVSGQTYMFAVPADWEPGSLHTVTLRVTDDGHWADGCEGSAPNLTAETTVTIYVKQAIQLYLDIKPGSCPNPLNLKSKGVLPLAVLGTGEFDVAAIDPASVRLTLNGTGDGAVAPLRWAYEDVATPLEGEPCDCHDDNGDGHEDLTLKFKTQELVAGLDLASHAGETIPLTLTGSLLEDFGGTSFYALDCVWIMPE